MGFTLTLPTSCPLLFLSDPLGVCLWLGWDREWDGMDTRSPFKHLTELIIFHLKKCPGFLNSPLPIIQSRKNPPKNPSFLFLFSSALFSFSSSSPHKSTLHLGIHKICHSFGRVVSSLCLVPNILSFFLSFFLPFNWISPLPSSSSSSCLQLRCKPSCFLLLLHFNLHAVGRARNQQSRRIPRGPNNLKSHSLQRQVPTLLLCSFHLFHLFLHKEDPQRRHRSFSSVFSFC